MTKRTYPINRPFFESFKFEDAQFSDTRLDQIHKLSRNFISSLNLGAPHVKHVTRIQPISGTPIDLTNHVSNFSDKDLYLFWVMEWKQIYAELSKIIRTLKTYRPTTVRRFPVIDYDRYLRARKVPSGQNSPPPIPTLNFLAQDQLPRLKETAQALLNARYNAKLASAERRRRHLALLDATTEINARYEAEYPELFNTLPTLSDSLAPEAQSA